MQPHCGNMVAKEGLYEKFLPHCGEAIDACWEILCEGIRYKQFIIDRESSSVSSFSLVVVLLAIAALMIVLLVAWTRLRHGADEVEKN